MPFIQIDSVERSMSAKQTAKPGFVRYHFTKSQREGWEKLCHGLTVVCTNLALSTVRHLFASKVIVFDSMGLKNKLFAGTMWNWAGGGSMQVKSGISEERAGLFR